MHVQAAWLRLAVTSALLATSGVLTVAASAQRWWPACRLGDFDSNGCLYLQNDRYGYIDPGRYGSLNPSGEGWVPIGTAAELHGAGMLVFAVAVLLLPGVLAARWPGRMLSLGAIPVSASAALAALPTLLSGLKGEAVSLPDMWLSEVASVVYFLGLPALLIVSAVRAPSGAPRVELARWSVVLGLTAANLGITYLMTMAFSMYVSYDDTPWAEASGGIVLIGASVLVWLTVPRGAPVTDAEAGTEGSLPFANA